MRIRLIDLIFRKKAKKWQPTHESGVFIYLVKQTLLSLLVMPLSYLLFVIIFNDLKKDDIHYMIISYLVLTIFVFVSSIIKWTNSEKKYKEIWDIQQENMRDSEERNHNYK